MNSDVEIFSCEGFSHPIISLVQDPSYWIPTSDTYEHSPKQKPNRKPSDYYRETYVETFANISAETFAEKETKTAEASEWLSDNFKYFRSRVQIFYFYFYFVLNQPSQVEPTQVKSTRAKPTQANPSGPKPTQAINFGNHL